MMEPHLLPHDTGRRLRADKNRIDIQIHDILKFAGLIFIDTRSGGYARVVYQDIQASKRRFYLVKRLGYRLRVSQIGPKPYDRIVRILFLQRGYRLLCGSLARAKKRYFGAVVQKRLDDGIADASGSAGNNCCFAF